MRAEATMNTKVETTESLATELLDRVESASVPLSISIDETPAGRGRSVDGRIERLRAERGERGFGGCQGAPYDTWGN